jgi:hypothetical protein
MTTITWPRFMSHEGGPAYVECVHADDHRALQRPTACSKPWK